MHPPLLEDVLWGLGTALKLLLCSLGVYRWFYRHRPLLMVYLALLPAEALVVWWTYRAWGYDSRPAWYVYWSAAGIVLGARGLAIAELCSHVLSRYSGLWSILRKILIVAALILLACAVLAAAGNAYWMAQFVLTAQQGLEVAGSVVLMMLLAISVRYGLGLAGINRSFVLGFAFYSAFEALNRTFLTERLLPFFPWWDSARVGSFDVVMIFWALSLLRSADTPEPYIPILNEQVATGQLHDSLGHLRRATRELKRLGKATRK